MKGNSVPIILVNILADGEFHSGAQLGEQLRMSRAAINKHIQTLKMWGIDVLTVNGKGYSLLSSIQLLNEKSINAQLYDGGMTVIPVIDSTNQYLLERMHSLQSGDACVAEYQKLGRGRRGRRWFSPFGSNLYLSMYWRLEQGAAATMGLSLVVGIVIAEVLQKQGVPGIRVKWPNDIYLEERKLAGILVEITGKTGEATQIVIGAGINLAMRSSESSVIDTPGWISLQDAGVTVDRNMLLALIINKMRIALAEFEQEGLAPFIKRWARLDNFINRPVKLIIGDREICGIARGIDQQGGLILEHDNVKKSWVGGEISLRSQ